MSALRDDWVLVGFLAYHAGERDTFEEGIVLVIFVIVILEISVPRCNSLPDYFLSFCPYLPGSIEFPALLDVGSVVKELARVAEAAVACLLVTGMGLAQLPITRDMGLLTLYKRLAHSPSL